MAYKLMIADRAADFLDGAVEHLLMKFENPPAAIHLIDSVEAIYSCLEV